MTLLDDRETENQNFVGSGHVPGLSMETKPLTNDASWKELSHAAFRTENEIYGALDAFRRNKEFGDPDPTHNPLETIAGTPAEAYWQHFIGSRNQAETDAILLRINQEIEDRKLLAGGGVSGILMQMTASLLSPTTLIPGGVIYKGAKVGMAAGKSAMAVGSANAAAAGLQELLLQQQQYLRTAGESGVAIGGSFILGGVLGGAISAVGSKQLAKMIGDLEMLEALGRGPTQADPFGVGGLNVLRAAGAQQAGVKPPVEIESTLGLASIPPFSIQDPMIRNLTSLSKVAREVGVETYETVLATTRNRSGVPTAPVGGAIETRLKTQGDAPLYEAMRDIDTRFAEYYFGRGDVAFRTARSTLGQALGDPKLTHKQFREEVMKAVRRGDTHDIPEVAESAKAARKLFDKHADSAIELGLLDPDVVKAGRPTGVSSAKPRAKDFQTPMTPERKAATKALIAMEGASGIKVPEHMHDDMLAFMASGRPEAVAFMAASEKLIKIMAMQLDLAVIGKFPLDEETKDLLIGALKGDADALEAFNKKFDARKQYATTLYQDGKRVFDELGPEDGEAFIRDPKMFMSEAKRAHSNIFQQFEGRLRAQADQRGEANADTFEPEIAREIWDDAGQSYGPRVYNKEKIARQYPKFKGILMQYFANAQRRAGMVRARLLAKPPDANAEKTLEDLRQFVDADPQELADTVINHILGHAEGRMVFDLPASVRGPLKARTLRIRDELIEEFLENDIDVVMRHYTRSIVPDIEITRRFGSLDMQEPIAKINDEYALMKEAVAPGYGFKAAEAEATGEAAPKLTQKQERQLAQLEKDQRRTIQDLQAIVERLRGTYRIPDNPMGFLPRFGRFMRTLNYMRLLGGMTVSAIADVPRVLMTHGMLTTFRDGVAPLLTNLRQVRLSGEETKLAGTALDMLLNTRAMAVADVMDDYGRYSKFERAIGSMQDNFGTVALMNPWNSMMKQWVGMMTQTKILRAAQAVATGANHPKYMARLAASGIDEFHAKIIAEQFQLFGAKHGTVFMPNTKDWNMRDPNVRNALESFRGAIVRDVDRTIVTPGQDRPLWMSTEVGKIIGQFKSFGIASVQRTMMAGLQQRDAGVLLGIIAMIGMGAVAEKLKAITNQKKLPETDAQWIATAIDRSGVLGYMFEINHFAESATGGMLGVSALTGRRVSRYQSRNWTDSILGPTGGLANDIITGMSGVTRATAGADPQISESDIRKLRRALPYQNLFYLGWLFREAEGATSRALGAKPMKNNSMM